MVNPPYTCKLAFLISSRGLKTREFFSSKREVLKAYFHINKKNNYHTHYYEKCALPKGLKYEAMAAEKKGMLIKHS